MKFYIIFSAKLTPYIGKNIKIVSVDLEATDQQLIRLWNADTLLGSDRKISNYTTAVA
jgi:uncharacterized ubiquitin-like protein YukD